MKHNKKIVIIIISFILILTGLYFSFNKLNNTNKKQQVEQYNSEQKNKEEIKSEIENKVKDDEETKKYLNKKTENTEDEKPTTNNKESKTNSKNKSDAFTAESALEIAENKYGKDDDIFYDVSKDIKDLNGKEGYIIQVKSKSMIKEGGNGVLFSVVVSKDGEITELG